MNLTGDKIPAGFDARYALNVVLPLAEAAYAVMGNPGVDPPLPNGFKKTGLIAIHQGKKAAYLAQPAKQRSKIAEQALNDPDVFGLVGNNLAAKVAFVSFRGTVDLVDWEHNLDALYDSYGLVSGAGDVHKGFLSVYDTLRDSVGAALPAACQGCDHLLVTGHSLGGAVSVLCAYDLLKNGGFGVTPELYTFAAPRAGAPDFANHFGQIIQVCFRVVNFMDVVPQVPTPPLYEHVGTEIPVHGGFRPLDVTYAHHLTTYLAGLQKLP